MKKLLIFGVMFALLCLAAWFFWGKASKEIKEKPAPLELQQRGRVSAIPGDEFTITKGEERWINDFRVKFLGVVEDSRCPQLVVCIRAGTVTVEIEAASETIQLRMPAEAGVPNAAVVGSYIITLVGIDPLPKQDDTSQGRNYRATLRVDVHDVKG